MLVHQVVSAHYVCFLHKMVIILCRKHDGKAGDWRENL